MLDSILNRLSPTRTNPTGVFADWLRAEHMMSTRQFELIDPEGQQLIVDDFAARIGLTYAEDARDASPSTWWLPWAYLAAVFAGWFIIRAIWGQV